MSERTRPRAELEGLGERYGRPRYLEYVLDDTSFGPLNRRRAAEVAMAVKRPSGKILLQTKGIYPPGVFRLPTGGIKRGEDIKAALLRETAEETALDVEIRHFVASLSYYSRERELVFQSHLFLLDEVGGRLQEQEPEEGITGWIEVDSGGLVNAARRLRDAPGSWRPWGEFRALVIDALVPALS